MKKYILFIWICCGFLFGKNLVAQCGDSLVCSGSINSFPYVEDFEQGKGGWFHAPITTIFPNPVQLPPPAPYFPGIPVNDSWAFGSPLKPSIIHAASGDTCWVIGGQGAGQRYLNQEHAFVASPCFDFSGLQHPFISLYLSYDIEFQFDGAALQVSVDSGKSWSRLGSGGSGLAWYNNTSLRSSPGRICAPANTEGWTGNSVGWQLAKHDLSAFGGLSSVRFRLIFASDPSTGKEGLAFDDVMIRDATAPGFLGPDVSDCRDVTIGLPPMAWPGATYAWNTGANTSAITASTSGQYILTITDGAQTYADTINVQITSPATYTATVTDPSCNNLADGSISLSFQVPTPPSSFTFVWDGLSIGGPSLTGLGGGPNGRILTLVDSTGCRVQDTFIVNNPPPLQIDSIQTWPDFGSSEGAAKAFFSGNQGSPSFDWGPLGGGQLTDSISNLSAGTDVLNLTDGQGCTATSPYTIPYATAVFPGDCNHDQLVSLTDLLPIGLHFSKNGPPRPNASLQWIPQLAPLWGDTLANGKDLRHTDADGNGSINLDDTLAIQLNFGSTHNNQRSAGAGPGPKLSFVMPTRNLNAGETLRIPVMIGSIDTPVTALYGLSFAIVYDSSLVEPGSAQLDFGSSWFGNKNVDMIAMGRDAHGAERIYAGMVRFDSMVLAGSGRLFDLVVVLDDHIAKRDIPFGLAFSDIYAIGLDESPIELGGIPGESVITTSLDEGWKTNLQLFPQPAGKELLLQHAPLRLLGLQLYDLQGRSHGISWEAGPRPGQTKLDLSRLADGIYLLQIKTERGISWQRIVRKE
jgi:hypothetical protein